MDIKFIKGISEKRAEDFGKMGITTAEELVKHFPRGYLDLTTALPLDKCYNNEFVLTYGRILSRPVVFTSARNLKCVRVAVEQGINIFTAIWFNQPYVTGRLKTGEEYLFYGRVKSDFGGISLVNPSFEPIEKNVRLKGIVPVYSLKGSLTQKVVRDAIKDALYKTRKNSVIPDELIKKYNISSLSDAYFEVHAPTDLLRGRLAAERIATEEYFLLISAFKIIKGDRKQVRVNEYSCSAREMKAFTERFGFEFTAGQKKAVNEIFADLSSPSSMNRLLEGDVGSGKTAVALCAVYASVKSGYQAAMLAPTEILARQNYDIVSRIFPDYE
ncbi:MAG: DEAD/DEAH box helicase, partial [Clostridia bacterium]|nr:DEAD/DEAH box helicase [Clostridia bacterium]